jgi:hypothetical protein
VLGGRPQRPGRERAGCSRPATSIDRHTDGHGQVWAPGRGGGSRSPGTSAAGGRARRDEEWTARTGKTCPCRFEELVPHACVNLCVSLPRSRRDEAGQSPKPLRDSGIGPDSRAQFRPREAPATPQLIYFRHRPKARTDRPCDGPAGLGGSKLSQSQESSAARAAMGLVGTPVSARAAGQHGMERAQHAVRCAREHAADKASHRHCTIGAVVRVLLMG